MSRQGYSGASSSVHFSSRIIDNGCSPAELTQEDVDNLRFELAKIDDEIHTLRQVLLTKENYAADIRRQLGMSPLSNIKQNLSKGWHEVQTSAPYLSASATLDDISHSNVYMRTRDSLSHAGHVTSAALSSMGVAITRRLAEMSLVTNPQSLLMSSERRMRVNNAQATMKVLEKLSLAYLARQMDRQEASREAGRADSMSGLFEVQTVYRALPLPSPPRHTISVPTMRHSNTFKSFEEMVGNVKDKVTGSLTNNGDTAGFERRSARHAT